MEFGEEETEIVAMRSLDEEEVPLSRTVPISPDVEVRGGGGGGERVGFGERGSSVEERQKERGRKNREGGRER